ncbi:hypothetical protein [Chondromyces crocatus]|uniref:VWFC domain-containing protein n=1 Tax=Chondromyces crocatus TaxID=52 RepID=A0A0K1EA86_CHOCO|nr:hypothetical protein [Chondromyces crocatus]AKT37498.1 uncharacterized protein CMC5_016390 [Chondromyces crocatus]
MNALSFSFLRSSLLAMAVAAPAALTGCIVVSDDGGATCTYDGTTYEVGDEFPAASTGDGCTGSCTCTAQGETVCSVPTCVSVCEYEGQTYTQGDRFSAKDSCNTCWCDTNGRVMCTTIGCECYPESEWWRDYASESSEQCEQIDYTCPENTESFDNSCGCGCAQSTECEQSYDCRPPADCNIEELQAQCPYSEIQS